MITNLDKELSRAYFGKSTDTKPTDATVGNGAQFYEIDTQTLYSFDKEGKTWNKQSKEELATWTKIFLWY